MILQEIIDVQVTLDSPLVAEKFNLNISNLEINSNEIIGVIGKSGAGKTTFARLLAGLLKPTSGTILNNPENLGIGLSFQFPENQFYMNTILEDVMLGAIEKKLSNSESQTSAYEALDLVNLNPNIYGNRNHMALSGGEKRRAAIATIIALKPDLYIFDEPTAALDGIEVKNLTEIMNNISNQGKTIIIVSQDSEFLAELCDKLIVFDKGIPVYDGPAIDFYLDTKLTNSYGIERPPVADFVKSLADNGININLKTLKITKVNQILDSYLLSLKTEKPI